MAARRRVAKPERVSSQADPAVIAFLRELDHPRKQEIEAVRQISPSDASETYQRGRFESMTRGACR